MAEFKAFQGLRNDVTAERIGNGDLVRADNVDLDNSGKLLNRGGYLKKLAGMMHSLWAHDEVCLYVQGTQLKRLNTDLVSSIVVRNDMEAGCAVSYVWANDAIYYSNGKQTGIYSKSGNRTWGIVPPIYQPLAQAGYGDMLAGTYQFAITYVRSDGQESGTGIADKIELTTGAINFTDLPVSSDPRVTHKILYLTEANGEVLYRALTLTNATTSIYYNGGILRTPLDTQFCQHAPAGQLVTYYNGVMYVAQDNWLFHSKAFGYELFDLRDYFGFTSPITMLAPVQDGMFVGTQTHTYFLAGKMPSEFVQSPKEETSAIFGTLAYIPISRMKLPIKTQSEEVIPVWTSSNGICAGTTGGMFFNLTIDRYAQDPASDGAAMYRSDGDNDQYIVALRS